MAVCISVVTIYLTYLPWTFRPRLIWSYRCHNTVLYLYRQPVTLSQVNFVEFSTNLPERPSRSGKWAIQIISVLISGVLLHLYQHETNFEKECWEITMNIFWNSAPEPLLMGRFTTNWSYIEREEITFKYTQYTIFQGNWLWYSSLSCVCKS